MNERMGEEYFDVKPETPVSEMMRESAVGQFHISHVSPVVGMDRRFIHKVVGKHEMLSVDDVYRLLDQDCFQETFVPRSRVIGFLLKNSAEGETSIIQDTNCVLRGDSRELIDRIANGSVECVVTSTPYWAMRVYDDMTPSEWADGDVCPFGLEQTPESFIRHSVEILYRLFPKISSTGSVWWDIMDTYNTRTQIRESAVEALKAMQGKDKRTWRDHRYKRYSGGHSYLKDGEQCLIPYRIAERASRIGYYVKSVISWCKTSSLPEPQHSRVSRNVEYVLHLSATRTPKFHKESYLKTDALLGGRQPNESEKLSDFWYLPTSSGRDGHGAQFPLQLPGRCISISTDPGDLVLDPFAGAGNTLIAAKKLGRRYLGFDISEEYVKQARSHLNS